VVNSPPLSPRPAFAHDNVNERNDSMTADEIDRQQQ